MRDTFIINTVCAQANDGFGLLFYRLNSSVRFIPTTFSLFFPPPFYTNCTSSKGKLIRGPRPPPPSSPWTTNGHRTTLATATRRDSWMTNSLMYPISMEEPIPLGLKWMPMVAAIDSSSSSSRRSSNSMDSFRIRALLSIRIWFRIKLPLAYMANGIHCRTLGLSTIKASSPYQVCKISLAVSMRTGRTLGISRRCPPSYPLNRFNLVGQQTKWLRQLLTSR